MEYERGDRRKVREVWRLRADTIPKESGSISEAVTCAERAAFPGNRKLRQPGGKRRQSNIRIVLLFLPILRWNFIRSVLPVDRNPLSVPSRREIALFRTDIASIWNDFAAIRRAEGESIMQSTCKNYRE